MCHLLWLGGRTPAKILFARDSGRVVNTDLMPMWVGASVGGRARMGLGAAGRRAMRPWAGCAPQPLNANLPCSVQS